MTKSAMHEDKNHTSAGVCNSSFRANSLICIIFVVVQMPPADCMGINLSDATSV